MSFVTRFTILCYIQKPLYNNFLNFFLILVYLFNFTMFAIVLIKQIK